MKSFKTAIKVMLFMVMMLLPLSCNAEKYYLNPADLKVLSQFDAGATYVDLSSVKIDKYKGMATAIIIIDVYDAPNCMLARQYFYFDDATVASPVTNTLNKMTFDILDEGPGLFQGRIPVKGDSALLYDVLEQIYRENR